MTTEQPQRVLPSERGGGSPEPLIRATNLSAGYGGVVAIRDVDIEVNPGEVVALIGPVGAGKTTTLLSLAGELKPMGGSVRWNGSEKSTSLSRRARQGLGFVPEDRSVFWRLTVRQNLAVQRNGDPEKVMALFPRLGELQGRAGGLLSGGEQRMLAVGRALSNDARLLLADELSLGLAPMTVGILLQAIREAADRGLGALLVEQHVHRVLQIADRAYVMQRGRIRLAGTAEEVRGNLDEIQGLYLADSEEGEN